MENEINFGEQPHLTPQELLRIYQQTGIQVYKSMIYTIEGDSGEYDFLTEAVEMSADVPGMCIEIGLRRGMGTKTIIDAVRQYCSDKTVVAVDPFGSILYQPREMVEPCRLDYTNQMKAETLAALWSYVAENPVDFHYFCMTDIEYFDRLKNGILTYSLECKRQQKYSVIHFDGPHTVEAILKECEFFLYRTSVGGMWVFDDASPDFYDHDVIDKWLISKGFEKLKHGYKKAMYKKC